MLTLNSQIQQLTDRAICNRGTYLITRDTISVRQHDGTVNYTHRSHPLFESLVNFLPRSSEFDVDLQTISSDELEDRAFRYHRSEELKALTEFKKLESLSPKNLVLLLDRIECLKADGLPYAPLAKFWSKVFENFVLAPEAVTQLLLAVGTPTLPLTWDGNLVGYYRGSQNANIQLLVGIPDWAPGAYTHQSNKSDRDLQCGNLTQVMHTCTDLGVLFEAVVLPEHITKYDSGTIYATSMTTLGQVSENYLDRDNSDKGLVEIVSKIDSFGNAISIRRPLDAQSAISAVAQTQIYTAGTIANARLTLEANMSC